MNPSEAPKNVDLSTYISTASAKELNNTLFQFQAVSGMFGGGRYFKLDGKTGSVSLKEIVRRVDELQKNDAVDAAVLKHLVTTIKGLDLHYASVGNKVYRQFLNCFGFDRKKAVDILEAVAIMKENINKWNVHDKVVNSKESNRKNAISGALSDISLQYLGKLFPTEFLPHLLREAPFYETWNNEANMKEFADKLLEGSKLQINSPEYNSKKAEYISAITKALTKEKDLMEACETFRDKINYFQIKHDSTSNYIAKSINAALREVVNKFQEKHPGKQFPPEYVPRLMKEIPRYDIWRSEMTEISKVLLSNLYNEDNTSPEFVSKQRDYYDVMLAVLNDQISDEEQIKNAIG